MPPPGGDRALFKIKVCLDEKVMAHCCTRWPSQLHDRLNTLQGLDVDVPFNNARKSENDRFDEPPWTG